MSSKQDKQGVRTASDLERKYGLGKSFAEILGIATDARDKVDSVESVLRSEVREQLTSITRDTEEIVLSALDNYAKTTDLEKVKKEMTSDLRIAADEISMNFTSKEELDSVDGKVDATIEELEKHFDFGVSGLTIRAGENEMKIRIDNDVIAFYKGDIDESDLEKNRFGWWDGVDFHTGNIVVELNERAQFGNFAFIPRSNGSLDFLKVGG